MTNQPTVAILGTGIMGAPIARNLQKAGYAVRAWNRSHEKAKALASDGITVVDTPVDAAEGADFVMTILIDGKAVEETMIDGGALNAMSNDAIWLQCSTVGIEAIERLAELATQANVAFIDAPVVGTKKPAEDGTLTVLAAGNRDLEAKCQPVFDAIGARTIWLDNVGDASKLKLVVNSWVLAVTAAIAEAIALAEGLGLDPQLFLDTIKGSATDNPFLHAKGGATITRNFAPAFPTDGAYKDIGLILAAAQAAGINEDLMTAVQQKLERTVQKGHGDKDMAAMYHATTPEQ
ncbi:MAG TPA: NAD(P)-dependent oxidoreductase [Acidothermaceae bacterium]|nr:NAD(P)-dependent oxidoreductase [Acidothermaceae bacterium]